MSGNASLSGDTWLSILTITACCLGGCFAFMQYYLNSCVAPFRPISAAEGYDISEGETLPLMKANEGGHLHHNISIRGFARVCNYNTLVKYGITRFMQTNYGICVSLTACFTLIVFAIMTWAYQTTEAGFCS